MSGLGAKLLAKMGHIEGRGLGKHGEGIVAPIEPTTTIGRSGLGFSDETEESGKGKSVVTVSTAIRIVIHNNLPLHVAKLFRNHESEGAIEEILSHGLNTAYVVFKTGSDADAALSLDGQAQDHGPQLLVNLVREEDLPEEPSKRLTDARVARQAAIKTCTVRVIGLDRHKTMRSLNRLLKKDIEAAMEDDDDFYQHAVVTEPGEALIQFLGPDRAQYAIDTYDCESNGKWMTVHLECVPDKQMKTLLLEREQNGQMAGLWVGDLDANHDATCAKYVRSMFRPIRIQTMKKKYGQRFAFVTMSSEDASLWFDEHEKGTTFRGRWHTVQPIHNGDKTAKAWTPPPEIAKPPTYTSSLGADELIAKISGLFIKDNAPAAVPASVAVHVTAPAWTPAPTEVTAAATMTGTASIPAPSTNVKLTNLPLKASAKDIRDWFNGFFVKSIFIKRGKGYAFVVLSSPDDARRAVSQLNKQKLLGRPVGVRLAAPRN